MLFAWRGLLGAYVSLTKSDVYSIEIFPYNSEGGESCWRWESKTAAKEMNQNIQKSNLVARKRKDGYYNIYEKYRGMTFNAKSIWFDNDVITEQGTIELGKLNLKGIFDFPKPIGLIKKALQLGTNYDDIVLDFFAGSGTTAHAVMAQNNEDGGNRKYILVQLPEPTPDNSAARSAGYTNIAQITRERVKRAKEKLGYAEGFKSFKLDSSNYKTVGMLKANPDKNPQEIIKLLRASMFADNTLVGNYKPIDVVYEYAIKHGFTLGLHVSVEKHGRYTLYRIEEEGRRVWFSFDEKVEMDMAEYVGEKETLVLLDGALDDNTKLNLGFEREIETI